MCGGNVTVGSNPTLSAATARPSGRADSRHGSGPVPSQAMEPVLPADERHDTWMRAALAEATAAGMVGEVPIGAVVVHLGDPAGPRIISSRHNERESSSDPTAHAEVLALRDAAHHLQRWRLDDCLLVVTLEPCPMCAGAAWAARVAGVVFGASSDDSGALGTLYHLGQDPRLNHEFPVRARVCEAECGELLHSFFGERR